MAKLEKWQRWSKTSPCVICGGYGAYKPENRCKGFLTVDGEGAFCSTENPDRARVWFEALGDYLWFHPFEGEGEVGRRQSVPRGRIQKMSWAGLQRKSRRDLEAARRPDHRDFG